MKNKITLSILMLTISFCCYAQWELRDTTEFSQREGLPNFFNKIRTEQDVKIGFIGGSITAANGWRPKITSWLEENYSIDNLFSYSAAIGGTNSKYGVFRIDEHLLNHSSFDLIFIEFAVNDNPGTSSDVEKSMEGMVRKIWTKNPFTDICFVYTVRSNHLDDCRNGKMPLTATKHDSIASYYGIPSVLWSPQTFKMIDSDSVVWYDSDYDKTTFLNSSGQYVFTADKVHPTDFGHEVYKDVLAKCLLKIDTLRGVKEHILKPVLITSNYENTTMLKGKVIQSKNYDYVDSTGQLSYLDKFKPLDNPYFVSQDTNSTYQFSFVGNEMGLDIIVGPTGGKYIIEIDGVKKEFANWDGYCSNYRKQSRFMKLSETKKHIVKIYPSSDTLTLEEKRSSLNNDSRKADLDANPEKYDKNELIFSHIFLDGTMSDYSKENMVICQGDTIIWSGNEYSENGVFYSVYPMNYGIDSIAQLNLKVNPSYLIQSYDTITQGSIFNWYGDTLTESGNYQKIFTSITGCDSIHSLQLYVSPSTNIVYNESIIDIVVYPNPTTDYITLENNGQLFDIKKIEIVNSLGHKVLAEYPNSKSTTIDVSHLSKGLYTLIINDIISRKVMIN